MGLSTSSSEGHCTSKFSAVQWGVEEFCRVQLWWTIGLFCVVCVTGCGADTWSVTRAVVVIMGSRVSKTASQGEDKFMKKKNCSQQPNVLGGGIVIKM